MNQLPDDKQVDSCRHDDDDAQYMAAYLIARNIGGVFLAVAFAAAALSAALRGGVPTV